MSAAAADAAGWVVPLEHAFDQAEHGGKAVGLARLMQAGLPVPPGIVVAHAALRRVLALSQACDDEEPRARVMNACVPSDLASHLEASAQQLAQGGPLAVRSSAAGEDGRTASYAGQLDTVLGVHAVNGLEFALKQVWASRWSDRVLTYQRHRNALLAGIGVIVQRQVEAVFSGVLFTVSPDAAHDGHMLCEYDEGLGNRLVAGEVSPGRFTISRTTLKGEWQRDLESDARPSEGSIHRLATSAQAAERLFGTPQDIEWAIDRAGKVWLLQSRPITDRRVSAARPILWSNANVNENFPDPISPFLYSVAAPGYTHYFRGLGAAFGVSSRRLRSMESDLRGIIGVHAGRMYYNLTSIHGVLHRIPFGAVLARWFDDFVGAKGPEASPHAPGRTRFDVREAIELARIVVRTTWQYARLESLLRAFEQEVERYADRTRPQVLSAKSSLELRDDLRGFLEIRLHRWLGAGLSDAAAMATYGALKAVLARAFPDDSHSQLHHDLLKGLDGLASAGPISDLWALSRLIRASETLGSLFAQPADQIAGALATDDRYAAFNGALHAYLERWGYRFSGELMLTVPSFQERPHELLAILARYASQEGASPEERLADQKRERLAQTAHVLSTLATRRIVAGLPWPNQATVARKLIAAAQASIGCRERARLKQALLYNRLRRVALEAGESLVRQRRLETPDDVFYLTLPELDEILSGTAMFPDGVLELVALRKRLHERFSALTPPDVMTAPEGVYPTCSTVTRSEAEASDDILKGTSVCGGNAVGRARVLSTVAQTSELCPGDILVTRQTDPGWAPAFVTIGGLVLERGGMLSHGAILAREYGIPTVVGVKDATVRVPDGASTHVDGGSGVVEILR